MFSVERGYSPSEVVNTGLRIARFCSAAAITTIAAKNSSTLKPVKGLSKDPITKTTFLVSARTRESGVICIKRVLRSLVFYLWVRLAFSQSYLFSPFQISNGDNW